MRLIILPAAGADIENVYERIATDSVDAADRFFRAATATIDRLRTTPEMGRRRRFRIAGLSGLRSLHVTGFRNYVIYYRITEAVYVVRVLHASRDSSRALREQL